MALRKCIASNDVSSMTPLSFYKAHCVEPDTTADSSMESDVDIDLQEVYFLIMHFLSAGPCRRTCGQFWNELLEHQLLPRRYHAWYSRSGAPSGDEDDNGISFPLGYNKLVERYPHIRKDHLVKLLKKLILSTAPPSHGMLGGNTPNAADVPTLLGSGSFSLLESDQMREDKNTTRPLSYLRWPHMQADQVHGLSLREIGGGFSKHHRAPSIRAACYAIAKPSTMVQKMQIIKKLRGHQNAVYCAIFDRTGQYVITGSDDRLVKIWSMETAFCLSSCRGHEGDITDLAVSSNNALVASASNDCVIRVWRLPDGVPISVLRGHTGAVTAIAFSPSRAAIYQLLSSSDDGTCRIWDARNSQSRPRIYIPKSPDTASGNINDPLPSTAQQGHQILCCAYNANGSVFVTGSSDTYARVWNAVKFHTEDSELPLHEMDVLSGHENDVNYVQFSGCAVPTRSSTADTSKEENFPKFKNNWFTHDNIVTCSRDGSAIIWIPRSRRSHGKVGKWTRAYHLKVPPPPMPPQPARGGPRQRNQPAPRGVNMIVWSLDNRFVLAAIMDCRICVWNAVDGSLVHSLTGHSESTYVLDVHPFNPRIAMSAGYDGKIIVWDIWEGTPVRTYETGHFKLVDGKFSPDGTSIVVSDEVGQIYILATGQGESQKDAKYDQFFLGDYRPLGQDEHGNVLDQETQLAPHRRNIQDLLCDSSMIPYPEPYQNMYQQRRLGALGIEWRPPSVRFAVGPGDTTQLQNYELVASFVDPTRWSNPLPEEFIEMNWEQENEVQSEDTDSEYNLTDEYTSEGEHDNLSATSSGDLECSAEDSEADHASKEVLRRSKRKKHKREVEFTTSFGRRVKRRNLDDHTDTYPRINRKRKSRSGRFTSKRKSSTLKSTRPRRLAAKNALNLFSRITGASTGGEDDGGSSMSGSSDSESLPLDSNIQSNESDRSTHFVKETFEDDYGITLEPSELSAPQTVNKRRLILKLAVRDSRKTHPSEFLERGESSSRAASRTANLDPTYSVSQNMLLFPADDMAYGGIKIKDGGQVDIVEGHPNLSGGFNEISMKWGEVKTRTSKRLRQGDDHNHDKYNNATKTTVDGHVKLKDKNGSHSENQILGDHQKERTFENGKCKEIAQEFEHGSIKMVAVLPNDYAASCNGNKEEPGSSECRARGEPRFYTSTDNNNVSILSCNNEADYFREGEENPEPTTGKFWIRSERIKNEPQGPSLEQDGIIDHEDWRMDRCDTASGSPSHAEHNFISKVVEDDGDVSGSNPDHRLGKLETQIDKSSGISNSKRFNAVYKRSRTYRAPTNSDVMDENASTGNGSPDLKMEFPETVDEVLQTRTRAMKAVNSEKPPLISNFRTRECQASAEASNSAERFAVNGRDQFLCEDWRSSSRNNLGLRSARNRRGYDRDSGSTMHRRKPHHSTRKSPSWLMLSEQEESCRYIPQLEDEVAYLRQGHQEYIDRGHTKDVPPWRNLKGTVRAVEFCRVVELDYQPYAGSGDSSCKLTFEFIGQSSSVFGESFNLTLVDLIDCSDFLVERTRYDAAIKRNWTHRDKCQVWWENDDREGGSWWDGRILAVKPKCSEFPDSPWERYVIQYKEDSKHHLHSPWELHEPKSFWDHPHIDDESRETLLSALDKIEHISSRNKDCYGFLKLKEVAQRSDFLNRFPVPLSSELIRRRLDNNYYRNLEAVKHDADVMLSNAKSFFARNAELTTKMRRLSDWFQHNFFSL